MIDYKYNQTKNITIITSKTALSVIKNECALVKTVNSDLLDLNLIKIVITGRKPDWNFWLDQLIDPENSRPIQFEQKKDIKWRSVVCKLNLNNKEQVEWSNREIDEKKHPFRGHPKKGAKHIKATSTTLLSKDGVIKLFQNSYALGLLFDLNDCRISKVFKKDAWTNCKWWVRKANDTAKKRMEHIQLFAQKSITPDKVVKWWINKTQPTTIKDLKSHLRKQRKQKDIPQHNEVFAKVSKEALRAIVIPSGKQHKIDGNDRGNTLGDRMNALHKKYLVKKKLTMDIPILIVGEESGPREYSTIEQLDDVLTAYYFSNHTIRKQCLNELIKLKKIRELIKELVQRISYELNHNPKQSKIGKLQKLLIMLASPRAISKNSVETAAVEAMLKDLYKMLSARLLARVYNNLLLSDKLIVAADLLINLDVYKAGKIRKYFGYYEYTLETMAKHLVISKIREYWDSNWREPGKDRIDEIKKLLDEICGVKYFNKIVQKNCYEIAQKIWNTAEKIRKKYHEKSAFVRMGLTESSFAITLREAFFAMIENNLITVADGLKIRGINDQSKQKHSGNNLPIIKLMNDRNEVKLVKIDSDIKSIAKWDKILQQIAKGKLKNGNEKGRFSFPIYLVFKNSVTNMSILSGICVDFNNIPWRQNQRTKTNITNRLNALHKYFLIYKKLGIKLPIIIKQNYPSPTEYNSEQQLRDIFEVDCKFRSNQIAAQFLREIPFEINKIINHICSRKKISAEVLQELLFLAIEKSKPKFALAILTHKHVEKVNNYRDSDGNFALHHAVINNDAKLVAVLCEYKACARLKNKLGKTAIDIAFDKRHYRLLPIIYKFASTLFLYDRAMIVIRLLGRNKFDIVQDIFQNPKPEVLSKLLSCVKAQKLKKLDKLKIDFMEIINEVQNSNRHKLDVNLTNQSPLLLNSVYQKIDNIFCDYRHYNTYDSVLNQIKTVVNDTKEEYKAKKPSLKFWVDSTELLLQKLEELVNRNLKSQDTNSYNSFKLF